MARRRDYRREAIRRAEIAREQGYRTVYEKRVTYGGNSLYRQIRDVALENGETQQDASAIAREILRDPHMRPVPAGTDASQEHRYRKYWTIRDLIDRYPDLSGDDLADYLDY